MNLSGVNWSLSSRLRTSRASGDKGHSDVDLHLGAAVDAKAVAR